MSTKEKRHRKQGRPAKRWEDDLNIYLQPDRTNRDNNDLTSDATWPITAEDTSIWDAVERDVISSRLKQTHDPINTTTTTQPTTHEQTHQHHSTPAHQHNIRNQRQLQQTNAPSQEQLQHQPQLQQQQQWQHATASNNCSTKLRPRTHPFPHRCPRLRTEIVKGSRNNKWQQQVASNSMETTSQRQVTQGPQSLLSGSEQPNAHASRQNRGGPSIATTTGTMTMNTENSNNSASLLPSGNVEEHDTTATTYPPVSAVQTCCALTRRQLHQPQHSTRWGQQQPCQPQGTDSSKNGARNRAANATAHTGVQDELAVDFTPQKS